MTPQPPKMTQAVALRYDGARQGVPTVVASGRGELAEKILQQAREAGIYIAQDRHLLDLLGRLPVGQAIPPAAYAVVAELLALIWRLETQAKQDSQENQETP